MCSLCEGDQEWARQILMPEYTLLTLVAVVAVVAAELIYFKSGIFARSVLVDNVDHLRFPDSRRWLACALAPIVIYNPDEIFGLRAPGTFRSKTSDSIAMVTPILLRRRWGIRSPLGRLIDVEDAPEPPGSS